MGSIIAALAALRLFNPAGFANMAGMFTPRLDILPDPQRRLWPELSATPEGFALYGGTAIALRLGHRYSVDFDFFSGEPFNSSDLVMRVPYLSGATMRQSAPNTLTVTVNREGPVQLSYFGGLTLGQVEPHEEAEGPRIKVASLVDLAGMKAAVVTQRAELKDYLDIHALLTLAGIPLPLMLAAATAIYADAFNSMIALKAIAYHEDPALDGLPENVRKDLAEAVRRTDPHRLPDFIPLRRRAAR